nr:carboxymuconolactone decarboxylase family protein [Duganella lactea]
MEYFMAFADRIEYGFPLRGNDWASLAGVGWIWSYLDGVNISVSTAFSSFMKEAPAHAGAWMQMVSGVGDASALDKKTAELAYIAVLAATGNTSGIAFHVLSAKSLGASKQEVLSAVLLGLPAVGAVVIGAVPVAVEAYDQQG